MTYLLDTNACIELLNERDTPIAFKLTSVNANEVCLCSVVKAELYHGAYIIPTGENCAFHPLKKRNFHPSAV